MCIYINIYALEREESLYVYVGTETTQHYRMHNESRGICISNQGLSVTFIF